MTDRSVAHASFCIERTYDASPARVFAAWADRDAKLTWFGGGDGWARHDMEFRVGGRERGVGGPPGQAIYTFDALYLDIVEGSRIVYAYTMDRERTRISASLGTVEIKPAGQGSLLIYTEQCAFLDDQDKVEYRKGGTEKMLDALGATLAAA